MVDNLYKKMLTLDLKKYKTDILVVATAFFILRMLIKRRPGCYMTNIEIKNTMNVTINVLKILNENYNNSVTKDLLVD